MTIDGDLRAFALLEALIREDSEAIDALCADATAELVAEMVRTLSCALATVLEKNLGVESSRVVYDRPE